MTDEKKDPEIERLYERVKKFEEAAQVSLEYFKILYEVEKRDVKFPMGLLKEVLGEK